MTNEEAKEILLDMANELQLIPESKQGQAFKMALKSLDNENGRWILSGGYWRCSKCKEKALLKLDKSKGGCREYIPVKSNVCPNCGAKMESEGEEV